MKLPSLHSTLTLISALGFIIIPCFGLPFIAASTSGWIFFACCIGWFAKFCAENT